MGQWESGPSLYFMEARYYGPGVGRFISEDPYGGSPQDPASLHRYLYCGNGPVSASDPEGRLKGVLTASDCYDDFIASPEPRFTLGSKRDYCLCMATVNYADCLPCAAWDYGTHWAIVPTLIVGVGLAAKDLRIIAIGLVVLVVSSRSCIWQRCDREYHEAIADCYRRYGPPPKGQLL